MSEFKYPNEVKLYETLPDGGLRYGRLRQRAFRHLRDKAPFCEDGSLYDRMNPGRAIMPVNIQKVTVTSVSATGKVVSTNRSVLSPFGYLPGQGVYGN